MKEHKLSLSSFILNSNNSLFSIYNLPYGIVRPKQEEAFRVGVAIGDQVLDLSVLEQAGLLPIPDGQRLFNHDSLNSFASQGPKVWSAVRTRLQELLSTTNFELQNNAQLLKAALIPQEDVLMKLPFKVGAFTDFYASEHHATNVGKLFRGNENALLPNWKHIPVGYNGRASTVFPSGTPIIRPQGQIKPLNQENPMFSPSQKLDFELEMGFFVGVGNPDRRPISVCDAKEHIFGLVLLNDWSARDIQAFEYQPLGPFLSKSFATSISLWVVPYDALTQVMTQIPTQVPRPVDYLYQETPMLPDIKLQVEIQPKNSNERTTICQTNCKELYWTMEQMLAHHTVNNCIMNTGDLLGTGTISGPLQTSWGSLLELSFNGKNPVKLAHDKERTFLEDGDKIIMTGYCETEHFKIGFGSLEGTITPANR